MNDNNCPPTFAERLKLNCELINHALDISQECNYLKLKSIKTLTYEDWGLLVGTVLWAFIGKNIDLRPYYPQANKLFGQFAFDCGKEILENEDNGNFAAEKSWFLPIAIGQLAGEQQFTIAADGPLSKVDNFVLTNLKNVKNAASRKSEDLTMVYMRIKPSGKKPSFWRNIF